MQIVREKQSEKYKQTKMYSKQGCVDMYNNGKIAGCK